MSTDAQQVNSNANDGTVDGAVAALAGLDLDNPGGGDNLISFEEAQARDAGILPAKPLQQPRDPKTQQWAPKPGEVPSNDPRAAAAAALAAEVVPDQVSAAEEEFVEFPPETDGGEPRRVPFKDVLTEYHQAQDYKAEIAKLRQSTPPPQFWDEEVTRAVELQGHLERTLMQYRQMLQPQYPSQELLNRQSPYYDPDAYQMQLQMAQQMEQQVRGVDHDLQLVQAQKHQATEALTKARFAREQSKLRDAWPELMRDRALQNRVVEMAGRHYGISPQDFAANADARMYLMLRDLVAYHDGNQAQAQAVKVVRSAPKLVRGAARSSDSNRQINISTAQRRASQSGSIDDAANVIGHILNGR